MTIALAIRLQLVALLEREGKKWLVERERELLNALEQLLKIELQKP